MTGSCRQALPDVWKWWGGPHGYPQVVRNPPGCPGMVGSPSRMSCSVWEVLSYDR